MIKEFFNKIFGFTSVFFGFVIVLFTSLFFFMEGYSYSLAKMSIWPFFMGMAIMAFGALLLKPKADAWNGLLASYNAHNPYTAKDDKYPKRAKKRKLFLNGAYDVDSLPKALERTLPPYPGNAGRMDLEGYVKVRFLITRRGMVNSVSVLEESPKGVFHKAVLETVPKWRFVPAQKNGQAVDVWVKQTLNFKLDH